MIVKTEAAAGEARAQGFIDRAKADAVAEAEHVQAIPKEIEAEVAAEGHGALAFLSAHKRTIIEVAGVIAAIVIVLLVV